MDRIDTHLHLIYPDRFRYDWAAGIPALADKAFTLEDYHAAAAGCGITGSIFMEVDVPAEQAVGEAAWFCAMAEDPASRMAGVIAACRPEDPGMAACFDSPLHPRLVGFRRILHTQPDDLSLSPVFRDNVARVGAAGLTFDLCVLPRQMANGAALVDTCPATTFILDHCGVPDIASGDLSSWREQLRELARRPNLMCKISGIIAYAGAEGLGPDMLRPVVEHTIDRFGWDRVVWGSDWPVCNLTRDLTSWTRWLDEILAGTSDGERAALYHGNARRIYRL